MSNAKNSKTAAAKIIVIWTEGGETPAPFTTFAAFDAWARTIGCPVPGDGCYYKTKFVITWADGETYEGRVDLDSECMASSANILASHILNRLDWQAVNGSAREKAEAMAYAALYEIGDVNPGPSDIAINDNGSDVAALLYAMETAEATRQRTNRALESKRLAALVLTHYKGDKYDSDRPLRETTTMIRRELAAAGKAKTGPLAGCVCRVNLRRASMMEAIDVTIVEIPDRGLPIVNPRWVEADESRACQTGPSPSILSKRGTAMIEAAEAIVAQYNFNKSDSMTDYHHVGFYSGTTFASDIKEAARVDIRAALVLLKQA